jgi:hypothetical protein
VRAPGRPLFLARQAYRHRRLIDAARLLPFVGGFLFMVPVFWHPADTVASDTAPGGLYLFAAWALMVAGAWLLARRLVRASEMDEGVESFGPRARDGREADGR